jgi:outer membrane protein OmpA-like peptidoglycan-associated protein
MTRNGSGYDATAWFAVPVDPKKVDAVIFVITDRTGKVIGRIRKPVETSMTKAGIRIDKLPKGAKVSAYTVNGHGTSPRAPRYANLRHVDTRRNRTLLPSGGYRLLGSPLGDNVIFEGASAAFTPTAKDELDRVAKLAKRKGGQLYITGFARRNGINSDGWLLRLSKRRAEAVANYLADQGVTSWINWNGVGPATETIGTPENRNVTIRWAPIS